MSTQIAQMKEELLAQVKAANDSRALEDVRVKALGKNGVITAQMKTLGQMSHEERVEAGKAFNTLKDEIAAEIEARAKSLRTAEMAAQLEKETVDITLPPLPEKKGSIHPISQTMDELLAIFGDMGFVLEEGPDVEDDFHNFTALNFPPDHPAREMQDTFYMPSGEDGEKRVLRTHTSTVQIRTMQNQKPPIKMVCMGRCFRSDWDQTHTPMFHQIEGLMIDKATHMGHLKGCLVDFCKAYFGVDDLKVRFRPSFFPFVEPGAEMDIGCHRDKEKGTLTIGEGDDWLEILGCGMVHPNVLKNCGIDPEEYQGFAFGMGIERIAMLKYGIPDLRTFFEGDTRWLSHYGFDPLDRPNMATGL